MNGREMERRDFANRLSASGVGSGQGGRGMGGGRGRWTRTGKTQNLDCKRPGAGQGRTSRTSGTSRAEQAGQGQAEQSRLQPAASSL